MTGAVARESRCTHRARAAVDGRAEVFAEKAIAGHTRDIAERAGMTEPMVIRHFAPSGAVRRGGREPVVAFMTNTSPSGVCESMARPIRWVRFATSSRDCSRSCEGTAAARRDPRRGQFDDALAPAAERLQAAFGRIIEMFRGDGRNRVLSPQARRSGSSGIRARPARDRDRLLAARRLARDRRRLCVTSASTGCSTKPRGCPSSASVPDCAATEELG